jgi:diguanylate cyclase (GGDEF)-like protein
MDFRTQKKDLIILNSMNKYDIDSEQSKVALEALIDFVEHVNHIDSIEDACWHLAQHTIKSLGFVDCVVYLLDSDSNSLVQVAAYGPKNPHQRQVVNAISLKFGEGVVGLAAQQVKSMLINDTRTEPNYIVDDQSRLSELSVPICHDNKVLGVIDSEHPEAGFFNEFHCRYLEILGGIIASKISYNSAIEKLEQTNETINNAKSLSDTLLLISELSYNSSSIEDFYLGLHKIIEKQVATNSFFVVIYDKIKGEYSCPYLFDNQQGGEFDANIDHTKMPETLVAEVITKQESRIANFTELEKRRKKGSTRSQGPSVHSWLAVPFIIDSNTQGAIALQSYDPDIIFNKDNKHFLTFLAQHISSSIDKKIREQKLHFQALHDSVTGLTNRSLFLDRLEHAFLRAKRSKKIDLAVLFIDFDDFKSINDNFGHQAGDDILREAAKRMQEQLRSSDTLARLGGDEYAILLEDLENESMVLSISRRILDAMEKPVVTSNHQIKCSISIGICLLDKNVSHFEDLLKNADHAMYHAKSKGKNNIQLYEEKLHQSVLKERTLLLELREAVEKKQLTFYYQPIVDLVNHRVVGFEALMRWVHPEKGIIEPDHFIHLAETNDLMKAIDTQLLANIAEQITRWRLISKEEFYISINISAQRFIDSRLVNEISEIIRNYNIPKNTLVVELTERILMKNVAKARNMFYQLHQLGVKTSLDDFGTGYSSLSYIHQLPFDVIKIDRTFVSNLGSGRNNYPIISIIIALAETLNIELVAEGVESQKQLSVLVEMGCHLGQGFYLAKPLRSDQTDEIIKRPILDFASATCTEAE